MLLFLSSHCSSCVLWIPHPFLLMQPYPCPPQLHFQSSQPTAIQPVFSTAVDNALAKKPSPFWKSRLLCISPLVFFEIKMTFFGFHSGYKCNRRSLQKVWKTQKSTNKSTKTTLSSKLRGSNSLLTHQFLSFLTPFQTHLSFFFFFNLNHTLPSSV